MSPLKVHSGNFILSPHEALKSYYHFAIDQPVRFSVIMGNYTMCVCVCVGWMVKKQSSRTHYLSEYTNSLGLFHLSTNKTVVLFFRMHLLTFLFV